MAGQKDEKKLDQKGRVADQFHIKRNGRPQPCRPQGAHPSAENAKRNAKHAADCNQLKRDEHALHDGRIIFEKPAELESVIHNGSLP